MPTMTRNHRDARPGQRHRDVEGQRWAAWWTIRWAGHAVARRSSPPAHAKCRRRSRCRRSTPLPDRARRRSAAAAAARCFGPMPAIVFELRALVRRGAARAHAGDREAVRLVADLRHQHQRRRVVAQHERRPAVGEDQFLEPDLAPLALLDADDQRQVEPEFLEHLARHRHLALAAVDQHQVGQAHLPSPTRLGQLGVARDQHLAHRGVVVAAGRCRRCCSAGTRRSASGGSRRPRTRPASPRRRCG